MSPLAWMLERLFPPKCVLCRKLLTREETDLCAACRKELPDPVRRTESLSFVSEWTAVCYYEGKARQSLLRYKFSGRRAYAPAYGRLLAARILREFSEEIDWIVYVPVSARRRRKRGYDQSQLLAQAVGRELGIPVVAALEKIRDNPAQSGLKDAARRRANVAGVYRTGKVDLREKRVLLIDDVITTGATVSECARVLRTAGASAVLCAAFAVTRKNN